MYSYGQFVKTSAGRMRVRKEINSPVCRNCFFSYYKNCNYARCKLGLNECISLIPGDAYFEKPNVGGKDQHK